MPEPDFARLLREAEGHPLFERLRPFVRRAPRRGSVFHVPFEDSVQGAGEAAPSISWSDHARDIELIRRIGQEKFERHFLVDEECLSPEQAAQRCRITIDEAEAVRDFVFAISLRSHPLPSGAAVLSFSCVAKVTEHGGRLESTWTLPHLARGRYQIDYVGLQEFQRSALSASERGDLRALLGQLEGITIRHRTHWSYS